MLLLMLLFILLVLSFCVAGAICGSVRANPTTNDPVAKEVQEWNKRYRKD